VLLPLLGELPPKIFPPAVKNSACVTAIKIYISNKIMKKKKHCITNSLGDWKTLPDDGDDEPPNTDVPLPKTDPPLVPKPEL
jgi:hypothetical protein